MFLSPRIITLVCIINSLIYQLTRYTGTYLEHVEISKWFLQCDTWHVHYLIHCSQVKDRVLFARVVRHALQSVRGDRARSARTLITPLSHIFTRMSIVSLIYISQENHSNSNAQMNTQILRILNSRFALEHRYRNTRNSSNFVYNL